MERIDDLDLPEVQSPGKYLLVGAALVLATLIYLWFSPWRVSAFYGDDLDYYMAYLSHACGTHIGTMFTSVCHERFRPFAFAIISSEIALFSKRMGLYFAANVAIQALVAVTALLITLRLSRSLWVAICFSLIIGLSRFATYEMTQVIGPIESLASLCSLLAVFFVMSAEREGKAYRVALAIIAASLAVLAHERFVVLAIWLALAIAVAPAPRSLSGWRRRLAVAGAALVPVGYVLYKQIVLGTPFLIGTGGTHLSAHYEQVLRFGVQGVLSILGFNIGDAYLVGVDVFAPGNGALLTAAALLFSVAAVIFVYGLVVVFKSGKWRALRWPLLLLLLAGLLLGPGLLTIRLEQRWLYMPFTYFVLAMAGLLGLVPVWRRVAAAVGFLLCSMWLNRQIMCYYDQLFFVSSPHFAGLVERDLVRQRGVDGPEGDDIAFVADQSQCRWTLLNGAFFKVYEGKARHVSCFASVDAAVAARLAPATPIFVEAGGRLTNISDYYREAFNAAYTSDVKYDFLTHFPEGRINSEAPVDTPTRRGALLLPWRTVVGPRDSLTVLSGFSYQFPFVAIGENEHLTFGVGMIFHAPQSARAKVAIETPEGSVEVIYTEDLVDPVKTEEVKRFRPVDLDLSQYKGRRVAVTFSVESPGGNSDSHWVGFTAPRLVTKK